MNIEIAVLFDEIDGVFSEAANKAIANATQEMFSTREKAERKGGGGLARAPGSVSRV